VDDTGLTVFDVDSVRMLVDRPTCIQEGLQQPEAIAHRVYSILVVEPSSGHNRIRQARFACVPGRLPELPERIHLRAHLVGALSCLRVGVRGQPRQFRIVGHRSGKVCNQTYALEVRSKVLARRLVTVTLQQSRVRETVQDRHLGCRVPRRSTADCLPLNHCDGHTRTLQQQRGRQSGDSRSDNRDIRAAAAFKWPGRLVVIGIQPERTRLHRRELPESFLTETLLAPRSTPARWPKSPIPVASSSARLGFMPATVVSHELAGDSHFR
jgi:hypothetical protein